MVSFAHLSLSVDLDHSFSPPTRGSDGIIGKVVSKLLALAREWDIPLTWAAATPHMLVAQPDWPGLPASHEWALLADRSWAGNGVERFARELRHRQGLAREAGVDFITLALADPQSREFTDHLLKTGIQVVRTVGAPSSRLAVHFPAPTHRLGVLRVPTLARLPLLSNWSRNVSNRAVLRLLRAGLAEEATIHWVIDARRVADSLAPSLRQLGRLFAAAAAARDNRQLRIGTLAGLAGTIRPQGIRRQSRSILRAA